MDVAESYFRCPCSFSSAMQVPIVQCRDNIRAYMSMVDILMRVQCNKVKAHGKGVPNFSYVGTFILL